MMEKWTLWVKILIINCAGVCLPWISEFFVLLNVAVGVKISMELPFVQLVDLLLSRREHRDDITWHDKNGIQYKWIPGDQSRVHQASHPESPGMGPRTHMTLNIVRGRKLEIWNSIKNAVMNSEILFEVKVAHHLAKLAANFHIWGLLSFYWKRRRGK